MKRIIFIICIVLFSSLSYALVNDSRVYLPLDGDFNDVSPNSTNYTGVGTPSSNTTNCVIGTCYTFNGSNYAMVQDNSILGTYNALAMNSWVKFHEFDDQMMVFNMRRASVQGSHGVMELQYFAPTDDIYNSIITNLGTFENFMDRPTNVTINTWHMITSTWDGFRLYSYIDGVLILDKATSGEFVYGSIPNMTLSINPSGGNIPFNGSLDEFGIWTRNLTLADVTDLWNGGSGFNPFNTTNATINITSNATGTDLDIPIAFSTQPKINIQSVTGSGNETERVNNIVGPDCPSGNYSYGFYNNGTIRCRDDEQGAGGSGSGNDTVWNITGSKYIINDTGILDINETVLNKTSNATITSLVNQAFLEALGFNITSSLKIFFDGLYLPHTVDSNASNCGIGEYLDGTGECLNFNSTVDQRILISSTIHKPVNVTVTTGTFDSGDTGSLHNLSDGDTLNVSEVTGIPGFVITSNYSLVDSFANLKIHYFYDGTSGHTVDIMLFNDDTSTYDDIGDLSQNAGFEVLNILIPDSSSYVDSGGDASVLINHSSSGNPTHDISIDYLVLEKSSSLLQDHGDLVGLSDDDHIQYLPLTGTRNMTGQLNGTSSSWTNNVDITNNLSMVTNNFTFYHNGTCPIMKVNNISVFFGC